MADERAIKISFDQSTGTMTAVGSNVHVPDNMWTGASRTEKYEYQQFQGAITVVNADGSTVAYPDGCYLVRQNGKFISAVSTAEYPAWRGNAT